MGFCQRGKLLYTTTSLDVLCEKWILCLEWRKFMVTRVSFIRKVREDKSESFKRDKVLSEKSYLTCLWVDMRRGVMEA